MSSAGVIDTSLAGDPNVTLLVPYGSGDAWAKIIPCRKTVYVPAPYVGLLLSDDFTPVEAWKRVCRAIVDAADYASCWPIIDWLHATIV